VTDQVLRFADAEGLVERAAELLAAQLAEYQQDPDRIVHLCLTGGRIALRLYDVFGNRLEAAGADPSRMELWWTDERFTSTDDPARHAGPALALLAGKFAVDAARTHPMPAADGVADADAAAATYAKELADVPFDICLLSIGPEGHVAGIFPEHPSFEVRSEGRSFEVCRDGACRRLRDVLPASASPGDGIETAVNAQGTQLFVLYADGHVEFLTNDISPALLAE